MDPQRAMASAGKPSTIIEAEGLGWTTLEKDSGLPDTSDTPGGWGGSLKSDH